MQHFVFKLSIIQLPADGGPVYAETDLSGLIAEPWNAISSLALIFPALYWGWKLRSHIKSYQFIFLCIPLLVLGGTGSVLYHAARTSAWLLYLDVLPTAFLTIVVSIYFWFKLLNRWFYVLIIILPFTFFRLYLLIFETSEFSVNLSYFIAGVVIFLPIWIYLARHSYQYASSFVISVSCLILSLLFRELDHWFAQWLPVGSHFLWHIISGIGAFYLAKYLFQLRSDELVSSKV
ncbi:MAG: hypothetical protein ACI8QD_000399 [Cyclobacteriaceae bacterium]|jgi:hypothetical protein